MSNYKTIFQFNPPSVDAYIPPLLAAAASLIPSDEEEIDIHCNVIVDDPELITVFFLQLLPLSVLVYTPPENSTTASLEPSAEEVIDIHWSDDDPEDGEGV